MRRFAVRKRYLIIARAGRASDTHVLWRDTEEEATAALEAFQLLEYLDIEAYRVDVTEAWNGIQGFKSV